MGWAGLGTARAGGDSPGPKQEPLTIPSLPSHLTIPRSRTSSRPVFSQRRSHPCPGLSRARGNHSGPADMAGFADARKNAIHGIPILQLVRVSTDNALVPCTPLILPSLRRSPRAALSAPPRDLETPESQNPRDDQATTLEQSARPRRYPQLGPGGEKKPFTDSSPRAKSSVNPS